MPAELMGQPGLAHDLLAFVLADAGIAVTREPDEADVVVLTDPTPSDWADATARDDTPIVLVATTALDPAEAAAAVVRGADAVVHGQTDPTVLVEAVQTAAAGNTYLDAEQTAALARSARAARSRPRSDHHPGLTPRELQILASIGRGDSVKQTARSLGIAQKTVENLQGRLFAKLAVRNRAQAVARAHTLGLLDADPVADKAADKANLEAAADPI
jgi:DNA-binding NarL/FixJ family response regulator